MTRQKKLAKDIDEGSYFCKLQGNYAYIRISDSAAKFYGLDYENFIYGVSYNGNMASVEKNKMVLAVDKSVFEINRLNEEQWNETFSNPLIKET